MDKELINRNALKKIIKTYGKELQVNIAIEEMSELIKELCKDKRKSDNIIKIAEEMADVYVMLAQLQIIFDLDGNEIASICEEKIERTLQRIEVVQND